MTIDDSVHLRPTKAMAEEAARGLEWRRQYNRGGTEVGVARARDISNRINLSEDTISRMVSFFARHEVDKQAEGFSPGEDGYPSAGRIAWALWGGDPGVTWSNQKLKELQTDNHMNITINNRLGKVKLNSGVTKESADELIDKLDRLYGERAVAAQMTIGEIVCKADDAIDGIEVEINTPGGSVFEGQRIYNALREMSARGVQITATVNGLAASMGSVILMAGDQRRMTAGSRVMIHEASTIAAGDARALKKQAELLESISAEIAKIYAERTGMDEEEIREMMMAETWMTADEAKDKGFVDVILKNGKEENSGQVDIGTEKINKQEMKLIDRITNPSSIEAIEKIAALENVIATHDSELDAYKAKFESVEIALQEAAGFKAELDAKTAELELIKAQSIAKDEALTKVNEVLVTTEQEVEKAKASASEIAIEVLASIGQPEPILEIVAEATSTDHIEVLASLKGAARTLYYAKHGDEIRKILNK